MDERAPGAAVAVGERVDRLELGMGDRRLHESRMVVPVNVREQIVEQRGEGPSSAPCGLRLRSPASLTAPSRFGGFRGSRRVRSLRSTSRARPRPPWPRRWRAPRPRLDRQRLRPGRARPLRRAAVAVPPRAPRSSTRQPIRREARTATVRQTRGYLF